MAMEMKQAVEFLTEIAKKSEVGQFDIVAGSSESRGVSVFGGAVQNMEVSNSCGIGIRIFKNEKPGYASSEKFSEDSLNQTLKDAISNSEYTAPLKTELPKPATLDGQLNTYNPELENVSTETLLKTCLDIENVILAEPEIKNVPDLGAEISKSKVIFANSNGVFFENSRNAFGIGVGAVAERNGIQKMNWRNKSGRDFSNVSPEKIAKSVAKRARELLSPRPIQGGKMPIVLSKRISASLLHIYLSSFYADSAQKGLSKLAGRVGEKIAGENFSLWSDPLNPKLPASTLLDSECVPTARMAVVKNGIFESFLYNLESASKENRKSTGHGIRGFSGRAGTSFINAAVLRGGENLKELLAKFPNCLLITHLEGASGCNPISGEISIGAQGFLCEKENILHAVDNLTISSNFFDLLKNIAGVGDEYSDAFSSVKVPALAIEEMAVSV